MPVRQPLLVLPQRPQDPVPLERSLTPITTTRPSSRLSDHLTQEQQDVQAMSNDIAGRRALDEHRRSVAVERTQFHKDTPMAPSVPPAISVQAWDDQSDQVTTSSRTRIGNKSPAFTEHNSRYPRFEPSRVHEEMVRKETIRPPTFGGRSKNMQLGSVAESWGTAPTLEIPRGMFQLDDDPPSPPNGKTLTPAEIAAEKARRALLGIPGEKSGRPSIKDMEKEVTDKLKIMALNKERQKKDESSMQAVSSVADVCRQLTTSGPVLSAEPQSFFQRESSRQGLILNQDTPVTE